MVLGSSRSEENFNSLVDSLNKNLKERLRINENVDEITRKLRNFNKEKEENCFSRHGIFNNFLLYFKLYLFHLINIF